MRRANFSEILRYRRITSSRPDDQTLEYSTKNKRASKIVDITTPVDYKVEFKESIKKDKYPDLTRKLKSTVEHESDGFTNFN